MQPTEQSPFDFVHFEYLQNTWRNICAMSLQLNRPKLRIAILGSRQTGKSAIAVRYLTRRFISEYSSENDFLYSYNLTLDERFEVDVDILDTSSVNSQHLFDYVTWANAFAVVYSISDKCSFLYACRLLETISLLTAPQSYPTILLANKADLSDYGRQINVNSGEELSTQFDCPFYEVSAAQSYFEIILAFQNLIRLSKPTLLQCVSTLRTKMSPTLKVSKMFGQMFAKMGKNRPKKKQKSLSI